MAGKSRGTAESKLHNYGKGSPIALTQCVWSVISKQLVRPLHHTLVAYIDYHALYNEVSLY